MPAAALYLGYRPDDEAHNPYAAYYRPRMAPLAPEVVESLLAGPRPAELFPGVRQAAALHDPGYWPVETGYSLGRDGAASVFCLTRMRGVKPAMWDWWFAWHGHDARRYKLWHPQAHLHAAWQDGRGNLGHYVGRTSRVTEFIGATRRTFDIRFVPPATLGLDETLLARAGEIAVCARASQAGLPAEAGWMIHHVRPVPGGSEMRSRFWLAGKNTRLHGLPGFPGNLPGQILAWPLRPSAREAADLLVHCAQEMSHLASFLPELHAQFHAVPDEG